MIGKAPRTDYIELVPERDRRLIYPHATDKDKLILKGATNGPFKIRTNAGVVWLDEDITVTSADLDTGAMEAGKDYNLYACYDDGYLDIAYSLASTYPAGYTADNSIRAGGFHTLPGNVGTISGHPLSGYLATEILPNSVWDLRHRARNLNNKGLTYDPYLQLWIQIYHASDDGNGGVQSVNGATILDTMTWFDFVDRGNKVGMRLLNDREFQQAAMGSNEGTNVAGGSDPVTCALRLDTAGRTMIANNGCIGMTGEMYAWTLTPGFRIDGVAAHTHPENTAESYTQNAATGNASVDVIPPWSWKNIGGKGQRYTQGSYGETKLAAGGHWINVTTCGSRSRNANCSPWNSYTAFGGRFCVEGL